MQHLRWIRATRAAAAVGIVLFAALTLYTAPGTRLDSISNTWFYDGLMLLACLIAGCSATHCWSGVNVAGPSLILSQTSYGTLTNANYQTQPVCADMLAR